MKVLLKFVDDILEEKKNRNKQKRFCIKSFNGTIENLEKSMLKLHSHLNHEQWKILVLLKINFLRLAIYEILF